MNDRVGSADGEGVSVPVSEQAVGTSNVGEKLVSQPRGADETVDADGDIADWTGDIHEGGVIDVTRTMPSSSVHTCVTSPPYYNLRDYGVEGQIGHENSFAEYIETIVRVGRHVARALRPDGSWWLNLGDSYGTDRNHHTGGGGVGGAPTDAYESSGSDTLGQKNKLLMPHRVAIALQRDGWIVRNDVVWHKPNAMPSSVNDRLNNTYEMLFHLTPTRDYWYDLDAIREPYETELEREPPIGGVKQQANQNATYSGQTPVRGGDGKNPGDVFEITTKPFPEAHFAVYPEELCDKPIRATCPPTVCAECGTPYEYPTETLPIWECDLAAVGTDYAQRALIAVEDGELTTDHLRALKRTADSPNHVGAPIPEVGIEGADQETVQLAREAAVTLEEDAAAAWYEQEVRNDERTQACDCATDATRSGIVFDPFTGSGTTLLAAKNRGRRYIGVEINPEFVAMSQKRLGVTVDEPDYLTDDETMTLNAFTDGGGDV